VELLLTLTLFWSISVSTTGGQVRLRCLATNSQDRLRPIPPPKDYVMTQWPLCPLQSFVPMVMETWTSGNEVTKANFSSV
jgi:hypothetical protein